VRWPYKPGSVVDNHSSGTCIATCLKQPTQEPCEPHVFASKLLFYLVLLQVGFTLPQLLPAARCALTAPFQPYLTEIRRYIFCGTCHKLTLSRRYLAPCSLEPGLSSQLVKLKARLSGHLGRGFYLSRTIFAEVSTPCHRLYSY